MSSEQNFDDDVTSGSQYVVEQLVETQCVTSSSPQQQVQLQRGGSNTLIGFNTAGASTSGTGGGDTQYSSMPLSVFQVPLSEANGAAQAQTQQVVLASAAAGGNSQIQIISLPSLQQTTGACLAALSSQAALQ